MFQTFLTKLMINITTGSFNLLKDVTDRHMPIKNNEVQRSSCAILDGTMEKCNKEKVQVCKIIHEE